MVVTRCWSRSSKPSPGQCLTAEATPCCWNTRIWVSACRSMVARSEPKPRVATMALRKAALMSRTGVKLQLMPMARASSAMMRLTSAVTSRSSMAASASGLGISTPAARLMRLPSRSAEIRSGAGAPALRPAISARSASASGPACRVTPPGRKSRMRASCSGSAPRDNRLNSCRSFSSGVSAAKRCSTQASACGSRLNGARARWSRRMRGPPVADRTMP